MESDLPDDLFALRDRRFEFVNSLTSHAAQVQLEDGEELASGVVKVLPNALAFLCPDGCELFTPFQNGARTGHSCPDWIHRIAVAFVRHCSGPPFYP